MAYLKTTEIKTRLRELAEDGVGSVRAISASRFAGGLHDGLSEDEQSRLGILDSKPCEVRIVRTFAHPQRLVRTGNVQIVGIEVEAKVVRTVSIDGQVGDDIRDAIEDLAYEDGSALRQAYEWPGNLSQTTAGADTDLKSLDYVDSRARLTGSGTAGKALRLETIHRFTGTAVERPAAA